MVALALAGAARAQPAGRAASPSAAAVRPPGAELEAARAARAIRDDPESRLALLGALFPLTGPTAARHAGLNAPALRRELRAVAEEVLRRDASEFPSCTAVAASAIKLGDKELLGRAVAALSQLRPDAMLTHLYGGIHASAMEDWERAEREIRRAQALGFPASEAERILAESGIGAKARNWRYARYVGLTAAGWAGGLVLLLLVGVVLSRLTLRAVALASPEATTTPSAGMRRVRKAYAAVLGVTSFYFYLSLPMVLLLVIGAGGGIIYGFVALGRIPIKLVAVVAILTVITLWAMLKSLFARVRDEDPGERLEEAQAPALFAMLRELAQTIGTRPVDAVYLVPDASVAVFERGSFWKRMSGQTQRCLILGLGALDGLTATQLRAILAHEYGHFSNRDTAGGGLALHVRRTILASAEGMARGGAATWFNPAWLFLNAFHRIYLRVSHGASRLQEVLADRWAALTCGAKAFGDGLRAVIRRSIEFDLRTNHEIEQAIAEARPIRNLYRLSAPDAASIVATRSAETSPTNTAADAAGESPEATLPAASFEDQVEAAFAEAMEHAGSAYDSHPPPAQRIAWVERLTSAPTIEDDGASAWSLLAAPEEVQERMTKLVSDRVQLALSLRAAFDASQAGSAAAS
ncbi:MAG: M48 family metalloprotease [Deltaproteobacteria bacterium]|nr:M48 family metalloprotease [Deltaproteobacteria bacterium]